MTAVALSGLVCSQVRGRRRHLGVRITSRCLRAGKLVGPWGGRGVRGARISHLPSVISTALPPLGRHR